MVNFVILTLYLFGEYKFNILALIYFYFNSVEFTSFIKKDKFKIHTQLFCKNIETVINPS